MKAPAGHERAVELMQAAGLPLTTKAQEYDRTAEMVRNIIRTNQKGNGAAFAVWLLVDSGYNNADLREVAKRL